MKPAKTIPEFIYNFIIESNTIEGIYRDPTPQEIEATHGFLELDKITLEDVEEFVKACQPDAELRSREGLNVHVGSYVPPKGGVAVKLRLEEMLDEVSNPSLSDFFDPFLTHKRYESLHPFTDCNGRSGRVIWLWQMLKLKKNLAPLGFLQSFYYQTLSSKS